MGRVLAFSLSFSLFSESSRVLYVLFLRNSTYDNPRLFWSVLQEVIALENDYKSWDNYRADHSAAAEKEFQRRSDIMALGGEMKVTRK